MTEFVGGSSILFAHCTVCDRNAVNRLRAAFAPVCKNCGCKLKQQLLFGIATGLLSQGLIFLSIALGAWYQTPIPLVVGFALSVAVTGLGTFVPDAKDPETKVRMRMHELKDKAANEPSTN